MSADLDPAFDDGALPDDEVTSILDPEFEVNAPGLMATGDTARLVDDKGVEIGSASVTPSDVASGKINIPTSALDDGEYTFMAEIVDSEGNVKGKAPVHVIVITDRDGVQPSTENAAHGGDFNRDGKPDWDQNNVAQLPVTSMEDFNAAKNAPESSFGAIISGTVRQDDPGGAVVLDEGAQLLDIRLTELPADLPRNLAAATPVFEFAVTSWEGDTTFAQAGVDGIADMDPTRPGLQTRVVLELPQGVAADSYMKWNPRTRSWFDYLDDQRLDTMDDGATLLDTNGDGKVDRVVITFTDGGPGDDDGEANGTIVDPGVLTLRQGTPVYSIRLSTGDRYYTTDATEAAAVSRGTGNLFEGVRFDSLAAADGGVRIHAKNQPFTTDWFFGADGVPDPYACYVLVPEASGFMAALPGQGQGDTFFLYLNTAGVTQLMTEGEAAVLDLEGQGYRKLGAQFQTTRDTAFAFDAEGYLVSNQGQAEIRALVQGLAGRFRSTTDEGFVEAVEQDFLARVSLTGIGAGSAASAADLNAAFGTSFV
jgi:hypothetical protein